MNSSTQQLAELVIALHTADPTKEVSITVLPSTAKRTRKMQLRGRRTTA